MSNQDNNLLPNKSFSIFDAYGKWRESQRELEKVNLVRINICTYQTGCYNLYIEAQLYNVKNEIPSRPDYTYTATSFELVESKMLDGTTKVKLPNIFLQPSFLRKLADDMESFHKSTRNPPEINACTKLSKETA